jgi:catechol 2,3-dioxygenase-like lactoylglutathione lyase family enzyme
MPASSSSVNPPNPVLQLRLVVEVSNLDEAEAFYRDALGLENEAAIDGPDGARVVILQAGRATLELVNTAQRRMIDALEVGRDVAPRIRVAFEVDDVHAATAAAVAADARLVAAPVETPWRSLNARLDAPGDLHVTVFEELDRPRGSDGEP